MNRREFVTGLGAVLAAPIGTAQAANKMWTIGVLWPNSASSVRAAQQAFSEGLREDGFIDGHNIRLQSRFADGNAARLHDLATELIRLKVDVMFVSSGAAAVAAKRTTEVTPIVFMAVSDPVALGLTTTLARPDMNATGLTNVHIELTQKRLEMLKDLLPNMREVGVISPGGIPETAAYVRELEGAAKSLGLLVKLESVTGREALPLAFAALKKRQVGGVALIPDPLTYTLRDDIATLAISARLPVVAWAKEFAEAGSVLSYGPNIPAMARRGAWYVSRVLKGTKISDLPIEQPTQFELVINLKTAKALGLTIPPALLLRADQIIE